MSSRLSRRFLRERDFVAEWLRERLDIIEEKRLLKIVRNGKEVCWELDDEPEPLITVRIATYNVGRLVAERAIASIVKQTYSRLEILVIGDQCDDKTADAVRAVQDSRISFINLPKRGIYPEISAHRNKVAGSHPMNVALTLAKGKWIAPCDDDDEFTPDHVELLLNAARSRRLEMVYSRALNEVQPGVWEERGSEPLSCGKISHGSVLYAAGLRFMRHSNTSWKLHGQPSDWNLWKRMSKIGVKIGFLDALTYKRYLRASQRELVDRNAQFKIQNLTNKLSRETS